MLLLLVTFALSGVLVFPTVAVRTATSQVERFPCENCACGCVSADICWDRCCCHSDEEKLRWAASQGVTPPGFLLDRVAQAARDRLRIAAARAACCTAAAGSCCSASRPDESSGDHEEAEPRTVVGVLMWKAAECRGVQFLWSILAAVFVEGSEAAGQTPAPRLHWFGLANEVALTVFRCPDPPIP